MYFTLTPPGTALDHHGHIPEWRGDLETRHISFGHLELHWQSRVDSEDYVVEGVVLKLEL